MSRYQKLSNLKLMATAGAAVVVVIGAASCATTPQPVAHVAAAPATTASASATPTPAATPPPPRLTVSASVTRKHPFVGNKAGVSVFTVPSARITVVVHLETGDRKKTARADDTGMHTFWFPTGGIAAGYRVYVTIRVSANGRSHSSRAWFTPRLRPPPPPPSAPTPPAPSSPAPSGCYPKASTGNCYEPGEFCPHADAGMRGVAGDGEAIICEDNNGLRWEPA